MRQQFAPASFRQRLLIATRLVLIGLVAASVEGLENRVAGQELADLTAAEYEALERTNENSVTATISFLASDELGGRGTPSPELNIATAYVASRLRGAGAEGLGPDGSFFLESTFETNRSPRRGEMLSVDGRRAERTSVFNGGDVELTHGGRIPMFATTSAIPFELNSPIATDWTSNRHQDGQLERLRSWAVQAALHDATALVVLLDADSKLWELAETRQTRQRSVRRSGEFAVPILLVDAPSWRADALCELSIPANVKEEALVRNVIGVIRGSDETLANEAILFSAHLDHLGTFGEGEDTIYNGADDDASGVTAVLTLADTYGALETRPARSVIFMTFWGEERGLLGSREFVENSPWPLENVVANINIEMIGRPEEGARNKCWMTGWNQSDLGELVARGSRRLGVETFEHPSFSARLYRASDNYAFVQKGVIAHSFSAGSLHDDYHQPSDEWEKLDLTHMTQVIRGLFAGTLPIVKGTFTPAAIE